MFHFLYSNLLESGIQHFLKDLFFYMKTVQNQHKICIKNV